MALFICVFGQLRNPNSTKQASLRHFSADLNLFSRLAFFSV